MGRFRCPGLRCTKRLNLRDSGFGDKAITPRNRPLFLRGGLGDSARRTPCRACDLGRRGSRRPGLQVGGDGGDAVGESRGRLARRSPTAAVEEYERGIQCLRRGPKPSTSRGERKHRGYARLLLGRRALRWFSNSRMSPCRECRRVQLPECGCARQVYIRPMERYALLNTLKSAGVFRTTSNRCQPREPQALLGQPEPNAGRRSRLPRRR